MSNFIINPYFFTSAVAELDNTRSLSKSITTGVSNSVRISSSNNVTTYFNNVFGSSSSAFSISMWIRAGWNNSLNTNIHFFAVNADDDDDARNQQVRIFYNESNNRLESRMGEDTNNRSINFWPLHSHLSATGLPGSAASQYWSSSNRGSVNSNNFTHLVITKGTGTSLAANNIAAYWNGNKLGNAFYSNGNNFGQGLGNMTTGDNRRVVIGSNAHTFQKSGNNSATLYDEIAIFNTQLSDDEVTSIYNNGVPNDVNQSNSASDGLLMAYYRLEGTAGTTDETKDYTTNSNVPILDIDGDSQSVATPA